MEFRARADESPPADAAQLLYCACRVNDDRSNEKISFKNKYLTMQVTEYRETVFSYRVKPWGGIAYVAVACATIASLPSE